MQLNRQSFAFRIANNQAVCEFFECVRRVHPIEWFVGTTVSVNRYATVGFNHY